MKEYQVVGRKIWERFQKCEFEVTDFFKQSKPPFIRYDFDDGYPRIALMASRGRLWDFV